MSTDSYEDALKKLGELLTKKSDLGNVAAAKIKQLTSELEQLDSSKIDSVERIKSGFNHFKTHNYEDNQLLFNLKLIFLQFLVFACADSRVCPSHILNFQLGEAFIVRNIANMVPPYDKTKHSNVGAALEYPITVLNVESILVIGHSCCGGIKGLMAIEDDAAPYKTEFIEDWIQICAPAKNKTKQDCKGLSFDDQCTNCEKEAVNVSLGNLLSYPFVRERVVKNKLAIRGAHYDFVKGTFDLWELDFKTTPAFALS
ncbi:hypothetical protein Bca52824_014137 [Brassica carinata]|uniref:Carbonic anhydrase n=1 Tax=Brassica carinata TaxID=52824 RepID=A0A8X7VZK1_BRACI|nr:hypothetical protein Bca52824_014137 [Brassica carinata]